MVEGALLVGMGVVPSAVGLDSQPDGAGDGTRPLPGNVTGAVTTGRYRQAAVAEDDAARQHHVAVARQLDLYQVPAAVLDHTAGTFARLELDSGAGVLRVGSVDGIGRDRQALEGDVGGALIATGERWKRGTSAGCQGAIGGVVPALVDLGIVLANRLRGNRWRRLKGRD